MSEYSVYSNVSLIFECIFRLRIFVICIICLVYTYFCIYINSPEQKSVAKLAMNVYTRCKIETNRAVLTRFGHTAGPSTIQFAPVYAERTQCLHKETSKAYARRTADSATTTWHTIIGQYRKPSISEYSNIRGLFGMNIRSQILVFVPALILT